MDAVTDLHCSGGQCAAISGARMRCNRSDATTALSPERIHLAEYLSGTDPRDPESNLKITRVTIAGGEIHVRFTALANRTYTVQLSPSLTEKGWLKLKDVPAEPITRSVEIADSLLSVATGERYYRLVTPPVP